MDFIRELWSFLKSRKKLWLLPIILVLKLLGGLIVFVQGSAIAPFIYTVFDVRILGLSAFYHDSAAALIEDGEIIAAAQEERFCRKKHYAGFPAEAVRYCLAQAGVGPAEIDHIAFYDKPLLKFQPLLETYLA